MSQPLARSAGLAKSGGSSAVAAAVEIAVMRGITTSMSRTTNSYDNASMESFWATLKAECFGTTFLAARAQAHSMVFDFIETFFTPVRLHSAPQLQIPCGLRTNYPKQLTQLSVFTFSTKDQFVQLL